LVTYSLCRAANAPDEYRRLLRCCPYPDMPECRGIPIPTRGVAVASTEVERASGVDVADVPSANWGWSKINHRNWRVVGLLVFGLLLMFLDGNHVGHVENLYVIGFAAVVLFFVVRDWWGRRRGWLR
jgi:hypothetical protein